MLVTSHTRWDQYPEAINRLIALRKQGAGCTNIAKTLVEEFHDTGFTETFVKRQMRRAGMYDHLATNKKGVRIPATLIEPKHGYAVDTIVPHTKHPTGWEPTVEIMPETKTGKVVTTLAVEHATEEELLKGSALDPASFAIDMQTLKIKRWQVTAAKRDADGHFEGWEQIWNWYYAFNVRPRDPGETKADVQELIADIKLWKRPKVEAPTGDGAFIFTIADLQMGKDDGDGVNGTVRRYLDIVERAKDRVRDLRKQGDTLGTLYLLGLGDLVEGCSKDWYAQQAFRAQLNMRDQVKVARRLIIHTLKELAPRFEKVIVAAVGGNHGEYRSDGASATDFADNHDVAMFEMAEEVLAERADTFGHVRFQLPNGNLDLTLDVAGTTTTIFHGHQLPGGGGGAVKNGENWIKGQAFGMQPAGDATVFISGHNHWFFAAQQGIRTHFQCPAMDGGSEWFKNKTGLDSPPGILTMTIGSKYRRGWDNVKIL